MNPSWKWPKAFTPSNENWPSLSDKVMKDHEIVVCVLPRPRQENVEPWTMQGMVEAGFTVVRKSTVVVDVGGTIMAVFTLHDVFDEDLDRLPDAFETVSRIYPKPTRGKNGIHMVGIRRCPFAAKAFGRLDGTYYVTRKKITEEDKQKIVSCFSWLNRLEFTIAPSVGAWRLETALEMGYPGLFPGVPLSEVSSHSVGISKGYVSSLHSDQSTIETIFWDSRKVKTDERYGFVIHPCNMVFDLTSASMVSIVFHAGLAHGTLGLNSSSILHGGIGAALVIKKNLLPSAEGALSCMSEMRRRLEELEEEGAGEDAPFMGSNFSTERTEWSIDRGRNLLQKKKKN
jgi:hypothetical protein